MKPLELVTLFLILFSIIWASLAVGVVFIKSGNKTAQKIRTWLVSKRIRQFQYPPFKILLRVWREKKFLRASATFIVLIILPAIFLFFLLGMILISPLLAIVQGIIVGLLIGRFDGREMAWAVSVGVFEFGYWALSGALGMFVAEGFLFNEMSFVDSILKAVDELSAGYWMPLVICVLGNAFGEIAGPIYLNVRGPMSLDELSQGKAIGDEPDCSS